MLFHFDQRLGPRLLFNVAEIQDPRITASLTRLMDFNFLQEMKAIVNAMANVVYSSMFFSIPNPMARGGVEQFMISFVIFDPTITEYLTISSLEEEMSKTISKLMMHGNTYTYNQGVETILYSETFEESDSAVVEWAKEEAGKKGLELCKVEVIGSKATSFSTQATWCEKELYRDDSQAMYFEGVFDGDGNKIDA